MEEGPERCVYVTTKRRRCRLQASKGSQYCGEHLIHDQNAVRKRVLCPLDPSHTVFEDALHKHLKKCNVAKHVKPAGYSPGINEGDSHTHSSQDDHTHSVTSASVLASCPGDKLEDLMRRVESACQGAGHMTSVKEEFLPHSSLHADLSDPSLGAAALKHLTQRASIVGHMGRAGLLDAGKASCYVEFGAGRGQLTAAIHRAVQDTPEVPGGPREGRGLLYVLVDKATCRRKVDGTHRQAKLTGATCHRLHMNIVDLDLLGVEVVKGHGVVGVAKHLCGAATDLALRCMVGALKRGVAAGRGQDVRVHGIAMALCCHHRCTWDQLVGRELLTQQGFTREDFDLLSHMTSWATCGSRPPPKDEGAGVAKGKKWGYRPHPNEGVGLRCKRLIDLARVQFLRENGLRPCLVHYVQKETSLENVLLLATVE